MKVFVSYSRTDAGHFAQKIYRDLTKKGHDVFIDKDRIKVGEIWSNTIEDNISTCDIFIIIVTFAALESIHVEREVMQAIRENKRIIPCFYTGIQEDEIKWNLTNYQGINEFINEYDLALKLYRNIPTGKITTTSSNIDSKNSSNKLIKDEEKDPDDKDAQNNNDISNVIKEEIIHNELIDITSSKEDSGNKVTLTDIGRALANLGKYDEAITWYDKALAIDPNYKDALNNKGYVLDNLGKHDEAITWYDKTLAIDPNYEDALDNKNSAVKELDEKLKKKKRWFFK